VDCAYTDLHTPRLRLCEPSLEDAERVFAGFGWDAEVTRYLTWRPHEVLEDAQRAMRARIERLADGVEYSWTIVLADTNELVGIISAWPEGDAVELGFVLARPHWGRGLMTEAVRAVTNWSLETPGVSRAWATTDVENGASARVLEKSGYARRGLFEREIVRPNLDPKPRPSLLFELRAV
jgi:RimJ/RimL family protein N-acetyltransferase